MAKNNKRTIYLGLDYTDFTGGVTEVNRKMGLLDAEFKLAQEQARNYGTETDELGVRHDYLRQKIELQTKKVEAAKKAYDEAVSSQNASEKQIDALNKKYIQESTQLEKLNGSLKKNEEAVKRANAETKTFGDEIRDLTSALGINVNPAIEGLASKFDGISAAAGNAVLVIGAVVSQLVSYSFEAAQFADDLLTMSTVTGIATDELQKMQYASSFLDVELNTMTDSVTRLTRNMRMARDGNKELDQAFDRLRVRVTDGAGQLKNANDVFYQSIDALGKVRNETERDALAMQIFGKSAKELNPLIEAGSDRLRELGIEAENMGVVMGEESLNKMGALQDCMDRFNSTTEALKNSLGLALIPVLTKLFDALSSIPVPVLQTLVTLATVVTTIVLVVKAIKSMTDTAKGIGTFFKTFDIAANKTTLIILGVAAAIIAVLVLITALTGKANDVNKAMNSVTDGVSRVTGSVNNVQTGVYAASNHASGTTSFKGGRTWVGEAGPELVTLPGGSKIETTEQAHATEYNNFYITIDAKNVDDFMHVVELAKSQKRAVRRGTA